MIIVWLLSSCGEINMFKPNPFQWKTSTHSSYLTGIYSCPRSYAANIIAEFDLARRWAWASIILFAQFAGCIPFSVLKALKHSGRVEKGVNLLTKLKCIFFKANLCISIQISLKLVTKVPRISVKLLLNDSAHWRIYVSQSCNESADWSLGKVSII